MLTKEDQKDFYLNLGILIREARRKMKISQDDLAQHLDLSRVSVVNIEKGRQKVQVHTLLQIGQYLGVSIDHLLHASVNHKFDKAISKEINSDEGFEKIKEVAMSILKNNKKIIL